MASPETDQSTNDPAASSATTPMSNPASKPMSKKAKRAANMSGKSYTAPKGRPTVHPTGKAERNRLSPSVEWILAIIAFVVVLGAIFYFGRGLSTGGGGTNGAPAPVSVVQVDDVSDA